MKRGPQGARRVSASFIILIIFLTSCAWVILDFYLVYVLYFITGLQNAHMSDALKLPIEERRSIHDVDDQYIRHRQTKLAARNAQDRENHFAAHLNNVKSSGRKYKRAVEKMKQMQIRHSSEEMENTEVQETHETDTGYIYSNIIKTPTNADEGTLILRQAAELEAQKLESLKMNRHKKGLHVPENHEAEEIFRKKTAQPNIWEMIRDEDVTSQPRDPKGPGEDGRGVRTLPEDEQKVKREWKKAGFNLFLNSKMSLERSLPDVRPTSCKNMTYPYNLLPKTSVIICFTDEGWSTLMRSVHSVLNRSPPDLLEEIILVDDFSQAVHLQGQLDTYVADYPKVKLLRLPSRHGLIRARLEGIKIARGPVLTFLDSHVEVAPGWLEPQLERIRQNKMNVVMPVIDLIEARSMRYTAASNTVRGGFTWVGLQFRWTGTPSDIQAMRQSDADPLPTPTMAGGIFSIDKQFFLRLGTYDPGLEIWGAENLELSFKSWMCGGRMEILPCSRVGHIFRKTQPYKFPSGDKIKTYFYNTLRIVNVWLDDYKNVFYAVNPSSINISYGDMSDRLLLKQELKCHNFDWYLRNIYPNLEVPPWESVASGGLINLKYGLCLERVGRKREGLSAYQCHGGDNQTFRLTKDGKLAIMANCFKASFAKSSSPLREINCDNPKVIHWTHSKGGGLMRDLKTNLCLGVASDKHLTMMPCFDPGPHLHWTFDNYIS